MNDHDDRLDLLDDDGGGVMEMCLFFDGDKKKGTGRRSVKIQI